MDGCTFERKAPFATTSFKKGGGCIFKGGLISGDYGIYNGNPTGHLPCLELFSCPLKPVVMVTKSWESREEHIELGIGRGHYHNSRLKHSKHGARHFLKNWKVQMLNAVELAAMDTLMKDSTLATCYNLHFNTCN